MGSCYSGDRIARDHIHTDKTTFNNAEPQKKGHKHHPPKTPTEIIEGETQTSKRISTSLISDTLIPTQEATQKYNFTSYINVCLLFVCFKMQYKTGSNVYSYTEKQQC